jgi:hypothetical protein
MKQKSKIYNKIYIGSTLPGRKGLLCRIVMRKGHLFMIEFGDHRRDWVEYPELQKLEKKNPVEPIKVNA